jgi:hypothetical protein
MLSLAAADSSQGDGWRIIDYRRAEFQANVGRIAVL